MNPPSPCAVSIYRIQTLAAAAKSTDLTWDNVGAATFSFLELSVGIIAICLPTLRPILVHAMPRLFGSLLRSTGHSGAGGHTPGRGRSLPLSGGQNGGGGTLGSKFKRVSTLRESDSTEGLRGSAGPELLPSTMGRLDSDIEFGDLESGVRNHGDYSVSVVGGWVPERSSALPGLMPGSGEGIKTTTVVTQKVSFAGEEEEEGGEGERVGRKSEKEERSPFAG